MSLQILSAKYLEIKKNAVNFVLTLCERMNK